MGVACHMVADCMVVANDAFVGPSQDLGVGVLPVRTGEFLLDGFVESIPIQVLNMVAIRFEVKELPCVDCVAELGGQVHDGVAFRLPNHLGQRST